jgi:1,4-alpha-glucan branching enzyme
MQPNAPAVETNIPEAAEAPEEGTGKAPIEFSIFAPYNENVRLLGSWNGWKPLKMKRDERGVWRASVRLADGDYEYKFALISKSYFMPGQDVTISDPLASEYTLDSRENSIVRVRGGQRVFTTYQWQHDATPLPKNNELIIYEMHVRDFSGGRGDFTGSEGRPGTFRDAIAKLDYLADLGINAIELMPINEFPGDYSWGYAQRSIYAVENSYGTPDELCEFVDEAHKRGIRIIHDAVYNHMESEAPLTRIDYTYWFYGQNPDEPGLQFGPKFNYEFYDEQLGIHPAREHVIEAMQTWIDRYHMDGIRFDCTRALRYFELLEWFHQVIHNRVNFKPFYTIAEHIPQDPAIAGAGGPMDAAWHDDFFRQISAAVVGVEHHGRQPFDTTALLSVMDGRNQGFGAPVNTIHYTENHDEQRTMWLLGAAANTFGEAAVRRLKLGASLLLLSPGVPMLWMGQEFGFSAEKALEPRPLDWALLGQPENLGLKEHYKTLIHLRRNTPALHSDHFQPVLDEPERGVLAFKRWADGGSVAVVAANLRPAFAGGFTIADAGLEDGIWRECLYGYEVQVVGGVLTDTLAEAECKVYIKL